MNREKEGSAQMYWLTSVDELSDSEVVGVALSLWLVVLLVRDSELVLVTLVVQVVEERVSEVLEVYEVVVVLESELLLVLETEVLRVYDVLDDLVREDVKLVLDFVLEAVDDVKVRLRLVVTNVRLVLRVEVREVVVDTVKLVLDDFVLELVRVHVTSSGKSLERESCAFKSTMSLITICGPVGELKTPVGCFSVIV